MRFGLIIYGDIGLRTGGFLYDRMIVNELRAKGHEVSIFAFPWRRTFQHVFDNWSFTLPRWLDAHNPDLLLQDELVHPSLFKLNRSLRQSYSRPILSIVHHLRSSEPSSSLFAKLSRWIEREYLNTVDGLICNSRATLESVHNLTDHPPPSIIAYPGRDHILPCVSQSQVNTRAQLPGPIRLLFIGSIIRRKGLDTLIKALSDIDPQCWHLDLVGDLTIAPRYAASIKRGIHRLGLTGNITWHGALPDVEVNQLWARSQVLTVPSEHEGFGIVYLEAMANGLVPIGSAAGGAGELIEDSQNGFLVNPGDSHAIQSHIQRLLDDRDVLSRMGIAGMRRYDQHLTWETTSRKIQSFLLERIAERP